MTNAYKSVNILQMITKEEVKNLASLARIEVSEDEMENLSKEMGSILDYVGVIKGVTGDIERVIPGLHNVMREDVVTNESGIYTEDLLNNAPKRDKNYLVVKKIL
ncbi:MAG: Asp-tRNA(Asn)/Glu-tRNA(Gln) amidotransferase subunit GatC [Patescibacteria group bacterium]